MTHPNLGDQLHIIEDDIADGWIEEYAAKGSEYLETKYLLPYAAFLNWLDNERPAEAPHTVSVYEPGKVRQAVGRAGLSDTVEIPFEVLPNYQSYLRY